MIYCQKCAADLSLASANRCPKCSRLFDRTNPRTFYASYHPSLYRPWFYFSRHPLLWSLAAIVTCLSAVVAGNGIAPIGYDVYRNVADLFPIQSLVTIYLLALWAMLLLLLLAFRKPGTLRTVLTHAATPLFALAIPAVILANIFTADPHAPVLSIIIPTLAWPALCLWTLALATDWHPIFRTVACVMVCILLAAYWVLTVFPPPPAHQALHPVTFIAAVPFFAVLLLPIVLPLWCMRRARNDPRKEKTSKSGSTSSATRQSSIR